MLVNIGVEQTIETSIDLGEYADIPGVLQAFCYEKQDLIGEAEEAHDDGIETVLDAVDPRGLWFHRRNV